MGREPPRDFSRCLVHFHGRETRPKMHPQNPKSKISHLPMPLYEFRCNDCGIFDEWRTMNESSNPAHCPNCQESAKRIFSIPGVKLNGALRLNKTANPEPQLVTKAATDPDQKTRAKSHGGRPWMISH